MYWAFGCGARWAACFEVHVHVKFHQEADFVLPGEHYGLAAPAVGFDLAGDIGQCTGFAGPALATKFVADIGRGIDLAGPDLSTDLVAKVGGSIDLTGYY
jgi:hypothetical protein